jgi:bacillithiol biosynthesis deacetylase BshB2
VQPIDPEALRPHLDALAGRAWYLHLETTAGAYTQGGFGAFVRNARLAIRRARVAGSGPYRLGLETEAGWAYAEGLTHWRQDPAGRLLLAGYDDLGRITVVCELSETPFPMEPPPRRLVAEPAPGRPRLVPPSPERAVVAVLAHPDDETFGAGGTLASYALGGVPVTCVVATRGEMGRQMGLPPFADRETLPEVRVEELRAAAAALGVRDVRLLGVWDKTTEFRDPDALADQVAEVLREVRPSLVLTSHPVHGGHPDHSAIGAATVRAVRRLPPGERPRVRCLVPPRVAEREGLAPQVLELDPEAVAAKEEATRRHRSQSEAMRARLERDPEEAARRAERIRREAWVDYPV